MGAESNVVTISQEEFQHLKFKLEEAQHTLSQKQSKLDNERTSTITHRQQLQDQLTIAIQRG